MSFKGHAAFDPQGEIDLAIDDNQDALGLDAEGDLLIVSPRTAWVGHAAVDPQEVDLAIDAGGDRLAINPDDAVLEVSRETWTGETASETL